MGITAPSTPRKRPRAVKADVRRLQGTVDWRSAERTQFLVDTVGGVNRLAQILGVSPSQPSRWRTGKEVPSPEVASRLLELDYVMAFALQAWHPSVAMSWMDGSNGFLGGARPIDVLRVRGAAEVVDALKATLSGAIA
jgi:uncharacterized protein (DUF2384 family)